MKKCSGLNQERNLHRSKQSKNSSKQTCGWTLMWETTGDALFHWRKSYYGLWLIFELKKVLMLDLFHLCLLQMLTDGLEWCGVDYCDVFIRTLILTAPIHCRASIAETLMQRHISTNLMKKHTHPNLRWPESSLSLICCILKTLMLYCFV